MGHKSVKKLIDHNSDERPIVKELPGMANNNSGTFHGKTAPAPFVLLTSMQSASSDSSSFNSSSTVSESCYETLETVWRALMMQDRRPGKEFAPGNRIDLSHDRLPKQKLVDLIKLAMKTLERDETLLQLDPPVVVCGDVHGQYGDLLDIFDKVGWPPAQRYLFMGDYVDRGPQSLEVICLLLYLKTKYPEDVFILRGNHETGEINATFGFRADCLHNYDVFVWDLFLECFRYLPLVGVVASRIVCMHGGISPHFENLDDIRRLVRPFEVPDLGLVCDLLWSDPMPVWKADSKGFVPNETRKTSYWFAKDVVEAFLKRNQLDLIVRGHEMTIDGYMFHFDKKLLTIFTAPQYCGFHNDAAVLRINEDLKCQVIAFHFKRELSKGSSSQSDIFTAYGLGSAKAAEPWNDLTLREPVSPVLNNEVVNGPDLPNEEKNGHNRNMGLSQSNPSPQTQSVVETCEMRKQEKLELDKVASRVTEADESHREKRQSG